MPKQWFDGLNALRGILFLIVFVSHSGAFFPADGIWGAAAVGAFFILSGFLNGYQDNGTGDLSLNICFKSLWCKLRKFWLLHVVFTIAAVVILRKFSIVDFFANIFLVQSYLLNAKRALSLNWPSWFLSSITLCYFLGPILCRLFARVSRSCVVVILCVNLFQFAWAYVWRNQAGAYGSGYYWVYICPFSRVFDFVVGVLLARFFCMVSRRRTDFSRYADFVAMLSVIVLALLFRFHNHLGLIFQYTAIWTIPFSVIVFLMAQCLGKFDGFIAQCRWLSWFGRRSFELYIVHRLILVVLAPIPGKENFFWCWVEALVVTCAIAEVIAHMKDMLFGCNTLFCRSRK